jgi:hypothetical protein
VFGFGSHEKRRVHMGDMGICRKPNMKVFDIPTPEKLIQNP